MKYPIVLAMTGASGAIFAVRLLDLLIRNSIDVHLTISSSGAEVIRQELGREIDLRNFQISDLLPGITEADSLTYHHEHDYLTPIASGSFRTSGMVLAPCSGSTLSAIAHGASNNLIQRAAEVHLKERRKLILMPRETPLSLSAIENMRSVTLAGAVVLPASPGWYHGVKHLDDLVDFIVARILDQLDLENKLISRWAEQSDADSETPTE
jgi:4-hydroxy-3-polyprenylbenzoate decarboxylase